MTKRTDYGKPGDPSGCYFPAEWRLRAAQKPTAASSVGTQGEARSETLSPPHNPVNGEET